MNLFDILGPVMVGPSSSHTAGAVRIGYISEKLLQDHVRKAEILLHGSFATTGIGHGTDKALIAGLLGMHPDDIRIPASFDLAKRPEWSLLFHGYPKRCPSEYCGSAADRATWTENRSAGGVHRWRTNSDRKTGRNRCKFLRGKPTLIVHNVDQPGHVAQVTTMLAEKQVNIATLQLYRDKRGGYAVMVIETDQEVPEESVTWLEQLDGIIKVTYINVEE